uniref:Uncharacterized protein n=1 Tax=viral metagenome TaxID=1070528 RepID=A0A6C0JE42_9ZZZZ
MGGNNSKNTSTSSAPTSAPPPPSGPYDNINAATLTYDPGDCNTECSQKIKAFCNVYENYKISDGCKQFCDANQGYCDIAIKEHCLKPENEDSLKCKCINSKLLEHESNPFCQDQTCIDMGYATEDMIQNYLEMGCQILPCALAVQLKNDIELTPTTEMLCKDELDEAEIDINKESGEEIYQKLIKDDTPPEKEKSYGLIIGLVIGGIVLTIIIVLIVLYFVLWKKSV